MTVNIDTTSITNQIKEVMNEFMASDNMGNKTRQIVDKRQLADALSVSISCIDQLRRDGIIRGLKIGKGEKSPVRFILDEVIEELKLANKI